MSTPTEFDVSTLAQIKRVRQELDTLEEMIRKKEEAGWECRCCKTLRPPDWFTYRVKRTEQDEWIEPACAICAREMIAQGPFKPFRDGPYSS